MKTFELLSLILSLSFLTLAGSSCNEKKEKKEVIIQPAADSEDVEEQEEETPTPTPEPTSEPEIPDGGLDVGGCYGTIKAILPLIDPQLDLDEILEKNLPKEIPLLKELIVVALKEKSCKDAIEDLLRVLNSPDPEEGEGEGEGSGEPSE